MAISAPLTGAGRPPFEGAYAAPVWPMSARTIGLASGISQAFETLRRYPAALWADRWTPSAMARHVGQAHLPGKEKPPSLS